MRNKINFFTIVCSLLLLACGRQKDEPDSFGFKPPQTVEAKKYRVPSEKTLAPKKIPVHSVKKVAAGKPEIVHLKSNVFPAKPAKVFEASSPSVIAPVKNNQLPVTVRVTDSPFLAGVPEIVAVNKDFYSKDENGESFSSMSVAHGLKYAEVNALCKDRAGNLWIATWDGGGVSKYDGRTLTNYSVAQGLSSEHAFSLLEDRNGNIWIGTDHNSVNKFDGKFITRYTIGQALKNNFVLNMTQDKKGNIWFGTKNGLVKYDGRSFIEYTVAQALPANYVECIFEDSKGNLWVGTKGGIYNFNGHVFQNYNDVFRLSENPESYGEIKSILEDTQGSLWVATTNDGLYKYDGKLISHFTVGSGLSSNKISQLVEDQRGVIWISTLDSGLNKFDGKSFTHYGIEQGLTSGNIFSMLIDRSGSLWLGTGEGINRHDGKLFSHIQEIHRPAREATVCITTDKNKNIWIGTARGSLNKYDGKSVTRFTLRQGLPPYAITDILENKLGDIWMATWAGGVNRFDGRSITNYSTSNGLIDNEVIDLLEDKAGNIWIGTDGGVSKFNGKYFINYTTANGLASDDINSLFEDHRGHVWFGTRDNGLSEFDGISFTNYNITNGLGNAAVTCIAEDKKNNLWLGTNDGLIKFDGRYFAHYTAEQGLNGNIVTNVLESDNGDIWIGTNNGLNRFGPHAAGDAYTEKTFSLFRKYTSSEGFLGVWGYYKTMIQDQSGDIWIGAYDRLTKYHPEGDIPDTSAPTIQLTGIALFDENINWYDAEKKKNNSIVLNNGTRLKNFYFSGLTSWHNQPENLQLAHDNNYITFQFIGITTNRPKEVRYRYILEGLDEHWSAITDKPAATYNNLSDGKYTFKVKAVNSEGYWSKELSYPLTILPPWWLTWWAYLSYAAFFCMMIWMLTWYRSRQLKAENILLEEKANKRTMELEHSLEERYQLIKKVESQEALLKERLRISRELHDDIGSTLSSISIYSEVAKKRSEKKQNTNEVLSKIGHASRELIDKMSDIVWSLNPNNESFEQLQNRMTAFMTMIFATRNIHYDFIADEQLKRIQFSGEQRKNIFLIFKEALHNIVKYAGCKTAHISMSLNNNNLIMVIKDDGKGFDVSQTAANIIFMEGEYLGGNGIKNMHARAEDMNAKLCIHSALNVGTTIQLTVQL